MSRLKDAATGAATGAAVGSVVPGIGNVAGAVIGGLGGLAGIGGTKTIQGNVFENNPNWVNATADQYNNANDFINWYNAWKDDDQDIVGGTQKSREGIRKKSWTGNKTTWRDVYGVNKQTGNQAFDDYIASGLGDFNKYKTNQNAAVVRAYDNKFNLDNSGSLFHDSYGQYLGDYYNMGNRQNVVNQFDTDQYNSAKDKLIAQHKTGYLSDAGYNAALQALNKQTAANQSALSGGYESQYNQWLDDLKQAWLSKYSGNVGTDDYAFLQRDQYMNADPFLEALALTGSGIQQYGSSDMASALNALDTYNPDLYVAEGANLQGLYNPFVDFDAINEERKRQASLENIGEF